MTDLLDNLRTDYPDITFVEGGTFYWSPENQSVTYADLSVQPQVAKWSLLHEVAHGILKHNTYNSDFELMQLEVAAWHKARALARKYHIRLDAEHIQDCLDTYRDWLHRRSTCPTCGTVSIQKDPNTYECFNCRAQWHVSNSRFCRPYRRKAVA